MRLLLTLQALEARPVIPINYQYHVGIETPKL